MRTREWCRIERLIKLDAFILWLLEQPDSEWWWREDVAACPLHDFIESETGHSLCVNSPEISEHWADADAPCISTPWWMTWMMRSMAHVGEGQISKDEVLALLLVMVDQRFENPLMSPEQFVEAEARVTQEERRCWWR